MLVMSSDGTEVDLPAIQTALDYLGVPYDTYIATKPSGRARFGRAQQRVSRELPGHSSCDRQSSFTSFRMDRSLPRSTPADTQTLATYEATFSVRQVTWYTFPTPDLGFNPTNRGVRRPTHGDADHSWCADLSVSERRRVNPDSVFVGRI